MAKKTYTALTAIHHDGEEYAAGDPVDMDDKRDAPALLAVGAIEPAAAKAGEKPAA